METPHTTPTPPSNRIFCYRVVIRHSSKAGWKKTVEVVGREGEERDTFFHRRCLRNAGIDVNLKTLDYEKYTFECKILKEVTGLR